MLGEKFHPRLPISSLWSVEQDNWNHARFSGLHEREHLERFIHCAETAGEKRESVCLFHEIQFAGEEVIEINQLRIALDNLVRALLEWETDVEPEAVFAAGATLCRAHDAFAAAGDDHVIVRDHFAREIFRHLEFGCAGQNAGRTKNDNLPEMVKGREDLRRVAHLFYGAIDQLKIRYRHLIARHFQRRHDHFLD